MRFIGIKIGDLIEPFICKVLKKNTWYPFGRYQEPTAENGWEWHMPSQRYDADAIDRVYQTMAENPKESLKITVNCIVGMNGSGKSGHQQGSKELQELEFPITRL